MGDVTNTASSEGMKLWRKLSTLARHQRTDTLARSYRNKIVKEGLTESEQKEAQKILEKPRAVEDGRVIKTEYKDLIIIVIERPKSCDYEIQFPNGNKAHGLKFEAYLDALNEAKAKIDRQHNPCSEPGCQSRHTTACFYPDNETGEPNGYYCYEHSNSNGFCFGCGRFWGGVESFEFGDGYCEDCADDESEKDWDDWDDD